MNKIARSRTAEHGPEEIFIRASNSLYFHEKDSARKVLEKTGPPAPSDVRVWRELG